MSSGCSKAPENLPESPAGMRQVVVTLETAGGERTVVAEVAENAEQQKRGLMERQSLAPGHGMLFPSDPPRPVSFWMRDTYIPLDIIFIAPDNRVLRVEANAVPFDETQILSQGTVKGVLELGGGEAARLGIAAGNRVRWPS